MQMLSFGSKDSDLPQILPHNLPQKQTDNVYNTGIKRNKSIYMSPVQTAQKAPNPSDIGVFYFMGVNMGVNIMIVEFSREMCIFALSPLP